VQRMLTMYYNGSKCVCTLQGHYSYILRPLNVQTFPRTPTELMTRFEHALGTHNDLTYYFPDQEWASWLDGNGIYRRRAARCTRFAPTHRVIWSTYTSFQIYHPTRRYLSPKPHGMSHQSHAQIYYCGQTLNYLNVRIPSFFQLGGQRST
jgi:hypothetical protein